VKPTVADVLQQIEAQSPEAVAKREQDAKEAQRTQQLNTIQATIIESAKAIINYLDGKVTKTEVINQIQSVRTPDSEKVVTALNSLHDTLKTHKNTDLTGVTAVLDKILKEAEKLPKNYQDIKIPEQVDYSKEFQSLADLLKEVDKSIKAQKLTAEAPVVNIPEPVVNVNTDLSPLTKLLEEATQAIKDNKPLDRVETEQVNTLIRDEIDEWRAVREYDPFTEKKKITAIEYFFEGKQVGTLKYLYDEDGEQMGAKYIRKSK